MATAQRNLLGACWLGQHGDGSTAGSSVVQAVQSVRDEEGVLQAVAYAMVQGGPGMQTVKAHLHRMDRSADGMTVNPSWLILSEYSSLSAALRSAGALQDSFAVASADDAGTRVTFHSIYVPFAYVSGPEDREDAAFSDVIQIGTFVMRSHEDERDLLGWYESTKLPPFEELQGGVRARPLVSVCGPTKYGVLYEFTSLEHRLKNFESVHEVKALDLESYSGKVVDRILHAPMSPSVGTRLAEAS